MRAPAAEARLRAAAALVYLQDLASPELEESDAHHLFDVLRLREGAEVVAADGSGHYRWCKAVRSAPTAHGRRGASVLLEAEGGIEFEPEPSPLLTVAFALQKGDRPELAVQKLTELGIDRIVPLLSERTVVRLDSAAERERRGERLRRVAREAGAQSRRPRLPEVADPVDFALFVPALGAGASLAEPGGKALSAQCTTVLVGPEGGWGDAELACGLGRLSLGDGVLRAETAAIAAGTLLSALRAGVVQGTG